MILIDTNALIILILGLIDINQIGKHKRATVYQEQDFYNLMEFIGDINNLVVLPNVWTEVDNHLNGFTGEHRNDYIRNIRDTINKTTEVYLESVSVTKEHFFIELGLTDSLLLQYAHNCNFLITSDSKLSDYAQSFGIEVYDMVKMRNERL